MHYIELRYNCQVLRLEIIVTPKKQLPHSCLQSKNKGVHLYEILSANLHIATISGIFSDFSDSIRLSPRRASACNRSLLSCCPRWEQPPNPQPFSLGIVFPIDCVVYCYDMGKSRPVCPHDTDNLGVDLHWMENDTTVPCTSLTIAKSPSRFILLIRNFGLFSAASQSGFLLGTTAWIGKEKQNYEHQCKPDYTHDIARHLSPIMPNGEASQQ